MLCKLHRRPSSAATICALALALALPLAACGGDDSNGFREDYNAAVEPLTKVNREIATAAGATPGRSRAAIADQFEKIADTTEEARDDLGELDPPEDAKDEFDKLLAALDKGVDDLRAVVAAAKGDSPEAAHRALDELIRSSEEISKAENALRQAVDR